MVLGFKAKLNEMVFQVSSKTNQSEFNELKDYSKTLCHYSDLKSLYDKVVPAIHNFEENMVTLEKDMGRNKQIIRR